MKKKNTNIPFNTYHLKMNGEDDNVQINIPKDVVFGLSMGHIWCSDGEDRDTYNFIASLPYTEEMCTFLLSQKTPRECGNHVYNVMNKYLVWILCDATPIEKDFPFAINLPVIDPFYVKTIEIDSHGHSEMFREKINDYRSNHDGEFPLNDELSEIEAVCIDANSTVSQYIKVNGFTLAGVDVTSIQEKKSYQSSLGVFRHNIDFYKLGDCRTVIPIHEDEFNNALSDILQDINVMF